MDGETTCAPKRRLFIPQTGRRAHVSCDDTEGGCCFPSLDGGLAAAATRPWT